MKKLKIKLEYVFNVSDNIKVIQDDWHGLFIVNDDFKLKSKPDIRGVKVMYEKFDQEGMLDEASLESDGGLLEDVIYNFDGELISEKTTIHLGDEKFQYNL